MSKTLNITGIPNHDLTRSLLARIIKGGKLSDGLLEIKKFLVQIVEQN